MEIKRKHIAFIVVIMAVGVSSFYFFWFRSLVEEAYNGDAPQWFMRLIEHLYPRFVVEKLRFDLAFFQNKADQVILRFCAILVVAGLVIPTISLNNFVVLHSQSISKARLDVLRICFYLGLLFFTWDWYLDFPQLLKMEPFYKGVHVFRLFQISLPRLEVLYGLYIFYLISILMILFNIRKVIFAVSAAAILVILQGYLYSFEKIEHGYATLTYACMLMPCLFYETEHQRGKNLKQSFILFMIQFSIAGAYFLSGAEKLLTGGLQWASTSTFSTYLQMHIKEESKWLMEESLLLSVLPWLVLFFQLMSITVPFFSRFRYFFVFSGIAFHWSTTWLMGIGAYLSPWIFVYIFFLDLEPSRPKFFGNVASTKRSQNGA